MFTTPLETKVCWLTMVTYVRLTYVTFVTFTFATGTAEAERPHHGCSGSRGASGNHPT